MQSKYDVVVVGAGPAGSTAARVTASDGLKTLLIDRRKEIGSPVQCGEYLPTIREMRTMFPQCPRLQKIGRIPSQFITNSTNEMIVYSPRLKGYRFPLDSNIIDRKEYDQHLVDQAVDAGATLLLGHRARSMTSKNRVMVSSRNGTSSYTGEIIIGADGPNSIIARSLGLSYPDRPRQISQSLQFVIGDVPTDITQPMMFFGHQVAPGGYAWIIPKSLHSANVGFGLRSTYIQSKGSLSSYLRNLISNKRILDGKLNDGRIISRVSASIPVGGPLKRTYSANALLVGDAAGHVMASNGGGIPTALAGGSIAGQIASRHLEDGLPLRVYQDTWKQEFGTQLYSALAVLRIADVMMKTDSLTEVAMGLSGARYLEDVIKCRVPNPLSFGTPLLQLIMEML